MEKNRNSKIVIMLALVSVVIGLSIGFAALDAYLEISNTGASVTQSQTNLNVLLTNNDSSSGTASDIDVEKIEVSEERGGKAVLTNAEMSSSSISGLSASFTNPGQSVLYTIYAHNAGDIYAFLDSIKIKNVTGTEKTKVCTPGSGATADSVNSACDGISLSVQIGTDNPITESDLDIDNHELDKNGFHTFIIKISYASDAYTADGDFTVEFGDIEIKYNSVD